MQLSAFGDDISLNLRYFQSEVAGNKPPLRFAGIDSLIVADRHANDLHFLRRILRSASRDAGSSAFRIRVRCIRL